MGSDAAYCAEGCRGCQAAVLRAYYGYLACGGDDRAAFRVAFRVLCLRHPGHSTEENGRLVTDWIDGALDAGGRARDMPC